MNRLALLALCSLLSCLLLGGCAGTPRQAHTDPARVKSEDLGEDALRDLLALSKLVIVARLEERTESEGTVRHRLRPREVLKGETKGEVKTSDFLYLPNESKGTQIGPLVELSHYLFFLAPGVEDSSPWFHLRDPSADPMPASQELVERVRAMAAETAPAAPADLPPGEPGESGEPREEPGDEPGEAGPR